MSRRLTYWLIVDRRSEPLCAPTMFRPSEAELAALNALDAPDAETRERQPFRAIFLAEHQYERAHVVPVQPAPEWAEASMLSLGASLQAVHHDNNRLRAELRALRGEVEVKYDAGITFGT